MMWGISWHELVYGTILTNIVICLTSLRYIMKMYRKYGKKVKFFFEKIDIMWFEYGAKRYPGLSQLEISNKLNKELETYVGYE